MKSPFVRIICITALSTVARAGLVTDWNQVALEEIRSHRTTPPEASRMLAMLHGSIHDAVNGVTRQYEQWLGEGSAPDGASAWTAANSAAYSILGSFYADDAANLRAIYDRLSACGDEARSKAIGVEWGYTVSGIVLSNRAGDGAEDRPDYVSRSLAGYWQPTAPQYAAPLLPGWGYVRAFGVSSIEAVMVPPPPALRSSAYARELRMVSEIGQQVSAVRTADQTQVAYFWSNGAGTATPPGHWNQILKRVEELNQPRGGWTLSEESRHYALLNLALADAAVACWRGKYVYEYWRPITAIQQAGLDGNSETKPVSGWTPLISTPPFPEYPSGHSTFSGAAAAVLAAIFGRDDLAFTIGADGIPGVQRSYRKLSEAAYESGMSRIYGGIHFMSANLAGLRSGAEIGKQVSDSLLRPAREVDLDVE
jgi:PAP2 superfamily